MTNRMSDDDRHARELRKIALKDAWPRWSQGQRDLYRQKSELARMLPKAQWHEALAQAIADVERLR